MTFAEREEKDWRGSPSQVIEGFLKNKRADTPCQRCGNNRFLVPEDNFGAVFVTYCSRCGFKNEYLVSILLSTESEK